MARKPASEDIEALLREALADPGRAALLLQVSYLLREPGYERVLRRVAALPPEACREAGDWLDARFPDEGVEDASSDKQVH